ncbi:MAG: hypothetical protein M3P18_03325 [Actinomycetota bacterium]|nr:hypothetical protein [Actinomycetota bacterium]
MRLLLIGLLATLTLQGQQQQEPDTGQQIPHADQRGSQQAPLVIQFDSAQRSSEADQREKDREEKTAADTAVIRATEILALIAFLQLVVFGYQAMKLRDTVSRMQTAEKITAESVSEMRRAADATNESVVAMKATAKRQLRAYVFVDRIDWDETEFPFPNLATYSLIIKNSGQTPAYHFSVKGVFAWEPIQQPAAKGIRPAPDEISRGTIPPGGVNDFPVGGEMLTPQITSVFAARTHRAFLNVIIEYTDAFGDQHHTNFRAFRRDGDSQLIASEDGNEAD